MTQANTEYFSISSPSQRFLYDDATAEYAAREYDGDSDDLELPSRRESDHVPWGERMELGGDCECSVSSPWCQRCFSA